VYVNAGMLLEFVPISVPTDKFVIVSCTVSISVVVNE